MATQKQKSDYDPETRRTALELAVAWTTRRNISGPSVVLSVAETFAEYLEDGEYYPPRDGDGYPRQGTWS